jgi:hypothetical protein
MYNEAPSKPNVEQIVWCNAILICIPTSYRINRRNWENFHIWTPMLRHLPCRRSQIGEVGFWTSGRADCFNINGDGKMGLQRSNQILELIRMDTVTLENRILIS